MAWQSATLSPGLVPTCLARPVPLAEANQEQRTRCTKYIVLHCGAEISGASEDLVHADPLQATPVTSCGIRRPSGIQVGAAFGAVSAFTLADWASVKRRRIVLSWLASSCPNSNCNLDLLAG